MIPSGKHTKNDGKIHESTIFNGYIHYKSTIFNSYVSLPEGTLCWKKHLDKMEASSWEHDRSKWGIFQPSLITGGHF